MSICWTSEPHWWYLQHWISLHVFNCNFTMTVTRVLHNDTKVSMAVYTSLHLSLGYFLHKIFSSSWIVTHLVSNFQLFFSHLSTFSGQNPLCCFDKNPIIFFFPYNEVMNFFACQKPILASYPWFGKLTSFCLISCR